MPKKPNKINECVTAALARIEYARLLIDTFHPIVRFINKRADYENGPNNRKEEFSAIHAALYEELNGAYDHFFLMSQLADEPTKRRARVMAYQRYFSEGMDIMWLTDPAGQSPSRYLSADREELQEALQAAAGDNLEVIEAMQAFWKGLTGTVERERAVALRDALNRWLEKQDG